MRYLILISISIGNPPYIKQKINLFLAPTELPKIMEPKGKLEFWESQFSSMLSKKCHIFEKFDIETQLFENLYC